MKRTTNELLDELNELVQQVREDAAAFEGGFDGLHRHVDELVRMGGAFPAEERMMRLGLVAAQLMWWRRSRAGGNSARWRRFGVVMAVGLAAGGWLLVWLLCSMLFG